MQKVLIISYYYPPSGGSGVQRWMYFAKYLSEFGIEPIVLSVDEKDASYPNLDESFLEKINHVKVYKTKSFEPLKIYNQLFKKNKSFAGASANKKRSLPEKIVAFIRGNFFIDARQGWRKYAYRKAKEIIEKEKIDLVITTSPPHSSQLIGLKLKQKLGINWLADFRDPWTGIYYDELLYKTKWRKNLDKKLETKVLRNADTILTVGPSMKKLLAKNFKENEKAKILAKTQVIYNGYEHELFENLKPNKNPNFFDINYIGLLGIQQDIGIFLAALKEIKIQKPAFYKKIRLNFAGTIAPQIIENIKEKLPDIILNLQDYIPHQQAIQMMLDADLLLLCLPQMPQNEIFVSGKTMEYIASGNPILGLGNPNGDAAKLIQELNSGVLSDQLSSVISYLLSVMSDERLVMSDERLVISDENLKSKISAFSRYETTRELAELIKKMI